MFTLPDLPYPYESLEPFIDAATMHLHHDKHHAAYVDSLNKALVGHDDLLARPIEDLLSNLSTLSNLSDLDKIKLRNHGGGHANHSFFWTVLTPARTTNSDTGGLYPNPKGNLATAIGTAFGNVDKFREAFTTTAMGQFGSGWAWLVIDNGSLSLMSTSNQDSPLSQGKTPILCLDVWEHAYYLKYQNRRAEYVAAWWNLVNWDQVGKYYDLAVK